MLTQERLRELLDYDPETGIFRWRAARGATKPGAAGCPNKRGYLRICIDYKLYYCHRLAWLYVHGEWPREIDHRDLDKSNNRIGNLRVATRTQNNANMAKKRDNTSGLKGAYFDKRKARWGAGLKVNKRFKFLGYFATKEQAHAAYARAATIHHGEFARVA